MIEIRIASKEVVQEERRNLKCRENRVAERKTNFTKAQSLNRDTLFPMHSATRLGDH